MNLKTQYLPINILLADDDTDDCLFFNKALQEISITTHLTIVHDGEQLMNYLSANYESLPDVLFLDLSMPRKTGFECLSEIKQNEKLNNLTVIMLSTSYPRDIKYEEDMINMLYEIGANHYIRKPSDFKQSKQVIENSLAKIIEDNPLKFTKL